MVDTENVFNTVSERVDFLSDRALFKGRVFRPEDLNCCKGIVIFTHGLGYCDRQYKIDGQFFAQNGYLLLIYNLRGHAGTPGKWTLQNAVEDLIEGVDFLVQKYRFENNQRICVIGHSTGALITLLASLKDKRIKFGSVVTTVTSLTDSYLHWFKSGFNQEVKEYFKSKGVIPSIIEKFLNDKHMLEKYRAGELSDDDLVVPHRYGMLKSDSFKDFFYEIAYSPDIIKLSHLIDIPILLFRGEYDEVMDVKKTHELYDGLSRKIPSKLYVTDSKNHFHNDRWDMIQEETLKFFDIFCEFRSRQKEIKPKDILIIDDEKLVTQTLKKLLSKQKILRVTVANSGSDALVSIAELKRRENKVFDLIVCDIRMPELDGIETVKRAKKIMTDSNVDASPIIFMTGYEGTKAEQDAKSLGYVDYLRKPFDTEDFLNSVQKHLR